MKAFKYIKKYWQEKTLSKKGLIIGILIGLIIASHYSFTDCHLSVGGPVGTCPDSGFWFQVAVFEFHLGIVALFLSFLIIIPFLPFELLFAFLGIPLGNYYFYIDLSIILIFALIGLFVGFLSNQLKKVYKN